MKTIRIQISDDTDPFHKISDYNKQIPTSIKNMAEFTLVNSKIIACIEDFTQRVKILGKPGTNIHIKKEFKLPQINIIITLDYPPTKIGLLKKLFGMK